MKQQDAIQSKGSIFLLLLFFVFIQVLLCENSGAVILISTIEDLQKIGNDPEYPLDGEYKLTQDIDASDTINWNGSAGFVPIGTLSRPFEGKFNGNGYKIQQLYINRLNQNYIGLFARIVSGGEVYNLGLENCWIVGDDNTGILAGSNYYGTVSNCYSTGSVSGDYMVGGLIGVNFGTVLNSYSTGNVTGNYSVGGILGSNYGMVSNCYSMCNALGGAMVGGFVGQNFGEVSNSYSTGSVSETHFYGGFMGYNGGTVTSCYWDIETSGQSSSAGGEGKTTAQMKQQDTYIGWNFTNIWSIQEGVSYPWLQVLGQTQMPLPPVEKEIWTLDDLNKIGRDWDYPWYGYYTLMADIDASVTISWDGGAGFKPINVFTGIFNGNGYKIKQLYINRPDNNYIGLFGKIDSGGEVYNLGLEDCQIIANENVGILAGGNLGKVTNSYSTGNVSGSNNIGGLVGWNSRGTVSKSYSTSSVSGNSDIGGLVGRNDDSYLVTNSYSTGSVSGNNNVGGLVGHNFGIVSNCYSTGSVSGSSSVGGLIGRNEESGTVMGCYWDVDTSGQGSSDGGEGKTTVQMKQQTTFIGWDFVDIWGIRENITYPLLREIDLPLITIIGNNEETIECGRMYQDVGATAIDGIDGNLTTQIIMTHNVDNRVPGDYTVDYSVTDSDNNTTHSRRIVHVIDTTSPDIALIGDNPFVVECHTEFIDPGAIATDSCDTEVEVEVKGVVDINIPGEYMLTYTTIDDSGNTSEIQRTVQVVDTTPPNIALIGDNPLVVECHTPFNDPGVNATDNCDADVTVEITGTVDINLPGEYTLIYTATDDSNNTSSQIERTVQVVDTTPPNITLLGDNPLVVECHTPFADPGTIATDSCDASVTVEVTGIVDINTPGDYTLTYTATDDSSNTSQVQRIVQVRDKTAPDITLLGDNPLIVECHTSFTDPGTTATDSCDASVTVEVTGTVDINTPGDYTLTYTTTDDSSNTSQVQRIVIVQCNAHSADQDGNGQINLTELLRVIQFFNSGGYHCETGTEDGYAPGSDGDKTCHPHSSDYDSQDWIINLSELLRLIQLFNSGGYHPCPDGEDGYCPGK